MSVEEGDGCESIRRGVSTDTFFCPLVSVKEGMVAKAPVRVQWLWLFRLVFVMGAWNVCGVDDSTPGNVVGVSDSCSVCMNVGAVSQ